jgi:hypothetical protein
MNLAETLARIRNEQATKLAYPKLTNAELAQPTTAQLGARNPNTGITKATINQQEVSGIGQFNSALPEGARVQAVPTDGVYLLREKSVQKTRVLDKKKESFGKIKILFSLQGGGSINFFIGGDRQNPKKIFEIDSSATIHSANIDNLGSGDRYIVSIAYSIGSILTIKNISKLIEEWTYTVDWQPSFPQAQRVPSYVGYGLWWKRLSGEINRVRTPIDLTPGSEYWSSVYNESNSRPGSGSGSYSTSGTEAQEIESYSFDDTTLKVFNGIKTQYSGFRTLTSSAYGPGNLGAFTFVRDGDYFIQQEYTIPINQTDTVTFTDNLRQTTINRDTTITRSSEEYPFTLNGATSSLHRKVTRDGFGGVLTDKFYVTASSVSTESGYIAGSHLLRNLNLIGSGLYSVNDNLNSVKSIDKKLKIDTYNLFLGATKVTSSAKAFSLKSSLATIYDGSFYP